MQAHLMERDEVLEKLETNIGGLQAEEAYERRKKYGLNELPKKTKRTLFDKIIAQFSDFLVIILLIAALVSILVGERLDALLIFIIVFLNATFGLIQENKADKALEALASISTTKVKILRNNQREYLSQKELVPGDIVVLEAGDNVPADLRLIETSNLEIEEATLTGESVPAKKDATFIGESKTQLADQLNMAFMSTSVTYGRGLGVVVNTGINTEVGKIADALKTVDYSPTPLQIKLDQLGKKLGLAILFISIIVFLVGLLKQTGSILELFMTAISLAVAAIPEGLPAVVTVVLALGMTRMSKKNAVIRRLLAVETLGTTTIICSDKTGTLTENKMSVVKIVLPEGFISVSGTGYNPVGAFNVTGSDVGLRDILTAGVLCNDSELVYKADGFSIIGDPTEGALVVVGAKSGIEKTKLSLTHPRLQEIPFDSDRKRMSTLHNISSNIFRMYTKGAPDEILKISQFVLVNGEIEPITDSYRQYFTKEIEDLSDQALRVLGFAYKDYTVSPKKLSMEDESSLVFIGLMAMMDPPRQEAKAAILECKNAGIRPIMITGDYKRTAVAIGKEIGLISHEDVALTGENISELNDTQLQEEVKTVNIYARVSPEHKVRIVNALKANGHVVAMTGDGVNDALALKQADIGISMGITGTDVAKETADMVLMDDNFATIVNAVREGRIIYSNIRKFVYFLLSCNLAEVLVILISMLVGLPIPLLPIQLLWVNVLTDAFPALALGVEKGEFDVMDRKPRNPKEPLLDNKLWRSIIVQSIIVSLATLTAFYIGYNSRVADPLSLGRTMAFLTLISGELFRAFSSRSEKTSLFKLGLFSNKTMVYSVLGSLLMLVPLFTLQSLKDVFSIVTLSNIQWLTVVFLGLLPLVVNEIYKSISNIADSFQKS